MGRAACAAIGQVPVVVSVGCDDNAAETFTPTDALSDLRDGAEQPELEAIPVWMELLSGS